MYWFKVYKVRAAVQIGIVLAILFGSVAQPYRLVVVKGDSMSPTYGDHSAVVVRRESGALYKGEVVILRHKGGDLIKRVAYLPGDQITQIWIGTEWYDAVDLKVARERRQGPKTFVRRVLTVPAGHVYVLGDNRVESVDSRTFGVVPMDDIWGELLDQRSRMVEPWTQMYRNGQRQLHRVAFAG
ncbi:MAG: signal peptidase I [Fimbriimonas sp.]|nr:signal peptidase I [Fimbriimonas sp.]